jgi:site-specific DNA-methyltransferase (adenine-specific)
MKYNLIYADPPWRFSSRFYQDGGRKMLALDKTQYDTMSISNIKNLRVSTITNDDCICFLWVTDSHLKDGIDVLESWGFKYKTIGFNWIKLYPSGSFCVNFAPWTLKSWEICLIGIKGIMGKHKKVNNIRGLLLEERTKHSKKPNEARIRIDKLFGDLPRIELFAREKHEGWDVWGNEVKCDIEL